MSSFMALQGSLNLVITEGTAKNGVYALNIQNPGASPAPEPLPSRLGGDELISDMVIFQGQTYLLQTTVAYP